MILRRSTWIPGGAAIVPLIPVWVANYAAVTSVTKTLQKMPEVIDRYRDAHSAFVQEP